MVRLNLSDINKSEIKYKISQFPDGQQDIVLEIGDAKLSGYGGTGRPWSLGVEIQSRFNHFRDLELIICATKALRRLGVQTIGLYIPYLLGARSDRAFQKGGNSYLVDVVAPIINAQNYSYVEVIDPHSDVAAACISNLKIKSNTAVASAALSYFGFWRPLPDGKYGYDSSKYVLVSPDAGALKKVYDVAKALDYKGEITIANKHRDVVSGKILSTNVSIRAEDEGKDFIIVDDICDGGRTFIELAKAIKNTAGFIHEKAPKVYLVVTHGIFSSGLQDLAVELNGIYSTNSVRDFEHGTFCKQMEVI